ncbi:MULTISPECIES: RNA polymerase sigma factor [Sphingobacterium]|uniref:RNA polymerase sigma factor n=1 Tax=Sphingobacterium TaxID=28453 RepID=UPI0013DBF769|nr:MULTISPECIES: sigma-70 family RNA polymerase sigma factor [unclassified Sphingobacterium]
MNPNELNSSHKAEHQLLDQLASGSHEAFEKLYRLHWIFVYNEAYRRLRNQDEAENITQDIFTTLWENREKTSIQELKSYLFVLTRNKTLNFILKNKPALITDYEENIQNDSSPLKDLLTKEAYDTVHEKILSLPPQQRAVFAMRYHENRSTDEIAAVMGLSIKTVRNHLGKAISAIRSILKFLILLFF